MKQFIVLLLLYFIAVPYAHTQTKVYTGKINDKYEIEMHLLITGKDTCGYYCYKNKNIPIPLHTMLRSSKLKLVEGSDVDGDAYFEGSLNGTNFTGTWNNTLNKSKPLPFTLTQINTETVSKENEQLSGEYRKENNGLSKELYITAINNKYVYVEIFIGSESCATSFIGIATIQPGNKAIFTDAQCKKLSFTLTGKTMRVTEDGCENYDGYTCPFAGTYHKE